MLCNSQEAVIVWFRYSFVRLRTVCISPVTGYVGPVPFFRKEVAVTGAVFGKSAGGMAGFQDTVEIEFQQLLRRLVG